MNLSKLLENSQELTNHVIPHHNRNKTDVVKIDEMEKGNSTALELMKNNTNKNTWKELQNAINKKNKPVAFINKNYLMMTKMKQKSRHASI